jgi:hypothetical protein
LKLRLPLFKPYLQALKKGRASPKVCRGPILNP